MMKVIKTVNTVTRHFSYSYRTAIVRELDPKLQGMALRMENDGSIVNMQVAIESHNDLIKTFKSIGLNVLILPSDGFADSVFVEDTAVVLDNIAFITLPGASSRVHEVNRVKSCFLSSFPIYKVVELAKINSEARMDGGDVLFTGTEFYVGLSSRTNSEGADALGQVFSNYPVHTIDIKSNSPLITSSDNSNTNGDGNSCAHLPLHLKSICTMCGPHHMLMGGPFSAALEAYMTHANKSFLAQYKVTHVPDAGAANVIYANNVLIRRRGSEMTPQSDAILRSLVTDKGAGPGIDRVVELAGVELAKVDGSLTCCALLIS